MTRASQSQLHLVEPVRVEETVNVSDLVRADIMRRDWSAVMIASDKCSPVHISQARKYAWR